MIRTISWTHFFLVVAVLVAGYYFIVGVVFFKGKDARNNKRKPSSGSSLQELSLPSESEGNVEGKDREEHAAGDPVSDRRVTKARREEPDLYPIANELVETIDEFIVKAGKSEMVKEEVVFGIHQMICRYPMLKLGGFKVAINNYIGIALKNNCAFGLDDLEMAALWSDEKKT
jgi:hypothetical protein